MQTVPLAIMIAVNKLQRTIRMTFKLLIPNPHAPWKYIKFCVSAECSECVCVRLQA